MYHVQSSNRPFFNIFVMKNLFFLFSFIFFNQTLVAQYYNKQLDILPNVTEGYIFGGDMDENNNIFTAFVPVETPETPFHIAKINPMGEVIANSNVSDELYDVIISDLSLLHYMNDTVFVHGSTPYGYHLVHIFNENLDSLNRTTIQYPIEPNIQFFNLGLMTNDENYIYLIGNARYIDNHPTGRFNAGAIMKLSRSDLSLHDYIIHPHDEWTDFDFRSLKFDSEGNLVVHYETFDRNGATGISVQHGRMKFDSDFNIIQQVELPFHFQPQFAAIGTSYELENGNFLFVDSGISYSIFSLSATAVLYCITPEGEEVWRNEEYIYENHGTPASPTPIRSFRGGYYNSDGNMIFISYYYDSSTPIEVRMICVRPEDGEIIWTRFYEGPDGGVPNDGEILGFYQDSDENYFMAGYHLGINGEYDHWIFRTDSHGCIESGCEITSVENPTFTENIFRLKQNPVSENITLIRDGAGLDGMLTVRLYSMTGRLLRQKNSDAPSETIDISTNDLPGGMYILSVADAAGRPVWQTKAVKL